MKFKAETDFEKGVERIVKSIPIGELENRELCLGCLAAEINLRDALHSHDDMNSGPKTSDKKCRHCYITEAEFGKSPMTPLEEAKVSYLVKLYENYKANRLAAG